MLLMFAAANTARLFTSDDPSAPRSLFEFLVLQRGNLLMLLAVLPLVSTVYHRKGTSECFVANQPDRVRFVLVAINFADIIQKLCQ